MKTLNTSQPSYATCPACGLLCDDIDVNQVSSTACTKSIAFFSQKPAENTPKIAGKPASLNEAIAKAAELLKASKQPLFGGLSTDLAGFRAVFDLAQKTKGHIKHMNAVSSQRNLKVLQSTGWQTTTLTEVKNRADVIVCFGDVAAHNPRFFERNIDTEGMFVSAKDRQVVLIGSASNNTDIKSDALKSAWVLPCRADDLPTVTAALRALVQGKVLHTPTIGEITLQDLTKLADKLKAAKYAVLAWVAKDFDFAHAELTIQNITQTVAVLNEKTRAGGLALGGSNGDTTVNYANTWLSGLTLNDLPDATPDLQIWVNSFNPDAPPAVCHTPTIILGHADTTWSEHADVFIPVATPGLDCAGTLFRVDGSVVLPLKKMRENDLPTLSKVVKEIETLL